MTESRIAHRRRQRKPRMHASGARPALLSLLAEKSSDVFFSVRFPEFRFEYISPSSGEVFGFTPQEFYQDAGILMRALPQDWRAQGEEWLALARAGALPETIEYPVLNAAGRQRWIRQRHVQLPLPGRNRWRLQGVSTDITELREAQQSIRRNEESYRQLIELWPDLVMLTVNLDAGRHEYVSPSMERVLGYAPQEFYDNPGLGMGVVAPRWQQKAWGWIADIKNGKLEPYYEFELVHKNGEHRWIHQVGVLRPRQPGQDLVVQFCFRDITERRKEAAALERSEARFRELAESWTDQALIRFNIKTGKHEYVSPGITPIFGYRPEEFYEEDSPALRAVLPEWRPRLEQWKADMRQGVLQNEYEYEVVDARGNRRWVLQRGSILRDEEGNPAILQAVVCDNTERRHLEDALRESNRRSALLSENLVDVVWALDAELRWTYLSPSIEIMTGFPQEVVYNRPFHETFSPESMDLVAQVLQAWAQAEAGTPPAGPRYLLMDVVHASGRLVPIEVLARPLRDETGCITGYCGTARDISARRRMERVEEAISRLARVLLECEDLAQIQMLAAACAEEVTGACLAVASYADCDRPRPQAPDSGLGGGLGGKADAEADREGALCVPVRHAGAELGSICAFGLAPGTEPEAGELLGRVASLFAHAAARIRAEEALRKSERMYRKLLESMHEGVWAVDAEQRTIFVNEHLAGMLGYSPPELTAMRPGDVLDPSQRLMAIERMQERRLGLSGSFDYELIRKDGTRLPAHVTSSPILNASGGYEGMVCTALNLSERQRMEEELRRNQARFEALYELSRLANATEAQMAAFTLREAQRLTGSSGGALFFASPDGKRLVPMAWRGPEGMAEPPVVNVSGGSPFAVVHLTRLPLLLNDQNLLELDLPTEHMLVDRFLGVPALDGDTPAAILGLTGKATPYTTDDSLQVSLLMDGMWRILRTRRDEERIRASLREKEALLREVHHRVKNNLQVVSSLLDMAARRQTDALTRRSLEEVRTKVLAMSLVHAHLHAEAPDGGGGLARGIDLERYVRALFRQLREIYSGDMDLSVSVLLDGLVLGLDQAAPLGLALNEILANVFKHGRREGAPGRAEIRARREPDGRVRIEVRDHGPGLPLDLMPEQAPSLGLKLMYGLVRHQLRGELDVESSPQGVVARIRFVPHIAG
ncbi:MAG: PAS domain S-box protein [Desulfovibrio sp.]|nr:PAS domain S-box protein [Desulfovibrio sp.]